MANVFSKKRFFSWLTAVLVMFALSNLYHNFILNDFDRILYPKPFFYSMLFIAYAGLSFLSMMIYFSNTVKIETHLSALLIGGLLGLMVYSVTISMGFSFNNTLSTQQMTIDLLWQIVEQGTGTLAGAICFQILDKGGFYINI